MQRLTNTVLALLAICLALPLAARVAYEAIPVLLWLLVLALVARLLWPSRRRR